jgi:hypothetical protein
MKSLFVMSQTVDWMKVIGGARDLFTTDWEILRALGPANDKLDNEYNEVRMAQEAEAFD